MKSYLLTLIWLLFYQTCTIQITHITMQDFSKSENTLADFSIRGCETLMLYIKRYTYMQVQC